MNKSITQAQAFCLKSLPNLRDIGGLPVASGHVVRGGQVFRGEGPRHLTADDAQRLKAFGFRLVVDLRSPGEREVAPNEWCAGTGVEMIHADVFADLYSASNEGWGELRRNPTAAGARAAMLLNYRGKPRAMAPHLQETFQRIIKDGCLPVLIHCTAGKDRTGFAIAMLLFALGASEDTVFEDYRRTNDLLCDRLDESLRMAYRRTFDAEPDPGVIQSLRLADDAYLRASLRSTIDQWGTIDAYLNDAIGLDVGRLERLREMLLI